MGILDRPRVALYPPAYAADGHNRRRSKRDPRKQAFRKRLMFDFAKSRAPRTTELYQSCWGDWEEYCSLTGARALPATAETVLEFLRAREPTHSNSALSARKSAIIAAHKDERSRLPKKKRPPYMLDHDDAFTL